MSTPRTAAPSPAHGQQQAQTPSSYPPPSMQSPPPAGQSYAAQPSPTHPPPSFSPALPVSATHSHLSPPSGVPSWQSKSVSECVFDCLHSEIIRYCTAQVASQIKSDDPKLLSRRLHAKLDALGFSIGQRYVERYSRDHPYLETSLDMVKFMCKEFWMVLFRKQVDKLQTNYKGIYVLHDFCFRWTARIGAINAEMDATALMERARVYTSLACGILRGALWNLGLNASVKAELQKLPAVQFTIMETRLDNAATAATTTQGQQQPATNLTTTTAAAAPPTHSAPRPPSNTAIAGPPASAGGMSGATPSHPAASSTARLRTSISANTLPTSNGGGRPGSAAPTSR